MRNPFFVGIGNAVVDILATADDAFLAAHHIRKGAMTLVEEDTAKRLLSLLDGHIQAQSPGGSIANSIGLLARLGHPCTFIGKVADDPIGRLFRDHIRAIGVHLAPSKNPVSPDGGASHRGAPPDKDTPDKNNPDKDTPDRNIKGTAHCLVLVGPDAQRSMQTYLGASTDLAVVDLDEGSIAACRCLLLEGYLWNLAHSRKAVMHAADIAAQSGATVAFSLSDAGLVKQHRDTLVPFIRDRVDLLFANQEEACALFGLDDLTAAADALRPMVTMAALTRSEHGSWIIKGRQSWSIDADAPAKVIDTTGAGDIYAAGFLHGYRHGKQPDICGAVGARLAGDIVCQFGAVPSGDGAARIADLMASDKP